MPKLNFTIDPPGTMVRQIKPDGGGARTATPSEIALWDALHGESEAESERVAEVDTDTTPVRNDLIEFLRGDAELEGTKFGSKNAAREDAGGFWWRALLPAKPVVEADPVVDGGSDADDTSDT